MARNRSNRRTNVTRDHNPITNGTLRLNNNYSVTDRFNSLFNTEIEDRRTWHPAGPSRPARMTTGVPHTLSLPTKQRSRNHMYPSHVVSFGTPDNVMICQRRSARRQVMHATGKAGKSGQRKPRYNAYSKISCRRSSGTRLDRSNCKYRLFFNRRPHGPRLCSRCRTRQRTNKSSQ